MNLFAAVGNLDLQASSKVPGLVASDLILIIGLATLVFGGIITWAVFVRGPRKHPSETKNPKLTPSVTVTDDGRERRRKKKRVRRRDHRQRNPTLSQTGGLPPPRSPEETASL